MSSQDQLIEAQLNQGNRPFQSSERARDALIKVWDAAIADLPDKASKLSFSRKRDQIRLSDTKNQLDSAEVKNLFDIKSLVGGIEKTWQEKHGKVSG